MDNTTLIPLLIILVCAGSFLYKGIRGFLAASKENRRVRELDRSGVRARGVIAVVHPLERSPHGHRVTVTVEGGDGRRWEAVDASGLNGYLVREGTPVELTYAAGDPLNIRVERAAFPLPPQGLYPLYPHGLPKPPSPVWPLLYAVGGAALVLGVGVLVLNGGEAVGRFVPLLFAVLGPVFLVLAVRGLIRRGTGERRLTAEATGVVTDAWTEVRRRKGNNERHRTYRVHPFTLHFRAADGREVHHRHPVASGSFEPVVDQPLQVRYDPEHPADHALVGHMNAALGKSVALFFIGLVSTVLGVALTFVFWSTPPV
ncbi:hypothetical protein GTW20_06970 [Nocardiopsis alba]|uniref:DUF3592 domain-containing protein n=1 Tax=Nocardiopsis alba TaxID=53437 RepID=A0A7K2IPW2_9ACTN|nr:DUF3592 domain-containing protein [Nocardiopsis alba]MYR32020.1 hypothetical protein [Nocardiopsis alba]